MSIGMRQTARGCVAGFLVLCAVTVNAEEVDQSAGSTGTNFGIGAGLDGNGGSVYFPIRISSWLIEPRISYSRYKDKSGGGGTSTQNYVDPNTPDNSVIRETSRSFERTDFELGLGIFGTDRVEGVFDIYYGVRAGYVKSDQKYKYVWTYAYTDSTSIDTNVDTTDKSGYFIAPALGVQYFFYRRASIGFEVALRYEKLTGDDNESGFNTGDSFTRNLSSSGDAESERFNTQTHAVIRAYF